MAINFPNSPGIGSVFTDPTSGFSYEWDGTVWATYSPSSLVLNVVARTETVAVPISVGSNVITDNSYAAIAGVATYATFAGIATYASSAGIATYATNAGIATYASNAGIATYASNAGIATYATNAGIATYASNAGIASYADVAGISTTSSSSSGAQINDLDLALFD